MNNETKRTKTLPGKTNEFDDDDDDDFSLAQFSFLFYNSTGRLDDFFFVWLLLLMAQVFFLFFIERNKNKQTNRKKTCEYNEGLKGKKSMMMSQTGAIYDARPMFFFHWLAGRLTN